MSAFIDHLKDTLGCHLTANTSLRAEPATEHKGELDESQVRAWWQTFAGKPISGWVQFSDANVPLHGAHESAVSHGPLLAAEFYLGDTSYQLRFTGTGWRATKLTQVTSPGSYLETRSLPTDKNGRQALHYEVAWETRDDGPLRPTARRLIPSKP